MKRALNPHQSCIPSGDWREILLMAALYTGTAFSHTHTHTHTLPNGHVLNWWSNSSSSSNSSTSTKSLSKVSLCVSRLMRLCLSSALQWRCCGAASPPVDTNPACRPWQPVLETPGQLAAGQWAAYLLALLTSPRGRWGTADCRPLTLD